MQRFISIIVVLNGNRCVSVSSSNPGHFIIGGILKTSSPLKSRTIKPDRNMNIEPSVLTYAGVKSEAVRGGNNKL